MTQQLKKYGICFVYMPNGLDIGTQSGKKQVYYQVSRSLGPYYIRHKGFLYRVYRSQYSWGGFKTSVNLK